MPVISYAHNFEDAMLWRALQDIPNGFYIDVGAAAPKHESVTQLFYERGWSGINIEPTDSRFSELVKERSRDINLQCLVGSEHDSKLFYSVGGGNGLSTTKEELALKYKNSGRIVEEALVPSMTLSSICDRYRKSGDIHFLKIDVEGAEQEVLESADFLFYRPWIVLIEATIPGTGKLSHDNWEYILLRMAYEFAWFDGINRFYIAQEYVDRFLPAFQHRIQVEEGFVRWEG
jgi:FkbM family methyltransferase